MLSSYSQTENVPTPPRGAVILFQLLFLPLYSISLYSTYCSIGNKREFEERRSMFEVHVLFHYSLRLANTNNNQPLRKKVGIDFRGIESRGCALSFSLTRRRRRRRLFLKSLHVPVVMPVNDKERKHTCRKRIKQNAKVLDDDSKVYTLIYYKEKCNGFVCGT